MVPASMLLNRHARPGTRDGQRHRSRRLGPLKLLLTALLGWSLGAWAAFGPASLAVVINDADPLSVQIGEYYRTARGIPALQLIHVRLPHGGSALTATEFAPLRARILAATPPQVQAYALTWASPYRVDCMSITSALSLGFDPAWCSRPDGCSQTRASPLYDYNSTLPWDDLNIRPSMAISATDFESAKRLIDRGVASDGSHPKGSAYLLITQDLARSARAPKYAKVTRVHAPGVSLRMAKADVLLDRKDVLFYFTGLPKVTGLSSLHFIPGAVGDHLTSFGGMLTDSPQMSALEWLQNGATGSYGTVREPCNYPEKFPDPAVLIRRYTQGETLIEAYWKSVSSPGEGIFIGEPLARPWGPAAR